MGSCPDTDIDLKFVVPMTGLSHLFYRMYKNSKVMQIFITHSCHTGVWYHWK